MIDQFFGTKELVQVVLKATQRMMIGKRVLEKGEPLLYFNKIKVSVLNQEGKLIMAKGGWGNQPLITWQDRGPVRFMLEEGVMSRTGFGLLFGADVLAGGERVRIPHTDIISLDQNGVGELSFEPIAGDYNFCYKFDLDAIQERIQFVTNYNKIDCGAQYAYQQVLVEYYHDHGGESLIYLMRKEMFNNINLRLEGKFNMKSENDGRNRTNFIMMPKVQVRSNINLMLGERPDPTVSVFEIVAMPEVSVYNSDTIMEIIALDENVDRKVI